MTFCLILLHFVNLHKEKSEAKTHLKILANKSQVLLNYDVYQF